MRIQSNKWLWSAIAAGCLASGANAQVPFIENYDSYAVGSVINGQGGWKQWGGGANSSSVIVDNSTGFARSGRAVAVDSFVGGETSDLVHEFTGVNTTKKTVKAYAYCPTGSVDKWFWILMSTYNDAGPFTWSAQVTFDPSAGIFGCDCGANQNVQGALVFDQWVEIRTQIDFAAVGVPNTEIWINGTALAPTYDWAKGVFGTDVGNPMNLAAVDLYHFPATTTPSGRAYWDDFSVTEGFPPPVPITYCVAKTNSLGCTPVISGTGQSSATLTSGFVVKSVNMRNNKVGLLFYTNGGQASTPFTGGTLCVGGALKRVQGLNTGGTPAPVNDCTGIFSVDMNSFRAGLLGGNPNAFLSVVGTVVDSQFWGRDPGFPAPNNTQLSDGLEFTVGN